MRNLEVHIQASDETMDGVYESEFEDSWEGDPQLNNIDLASSPTPSKKNFITYVQPTSTEGSRNNFKTKYTL